jgi:hypothetical protein
LAVQELGLGCGEAGTTAKTFAERKRRRSFQN